MIRWLKERVQTLIAIWMLLTLFIIICNGLFWINDYIAYPQHGLFDHFDEVSAIIQNGHELWYRSYFVLDFFWALNLLIVVGIVTKDRNNKSLIDLQSSGMPESKIFVIFAVLAFLTDVAEGVCYLVYWGGYLKYIVYAKIVCYAVCFCFLIYWLLKTYLLPNFKSALRFVWTSLFSIIFILIIYILITMMPQGGTLIVDLFYNPWNLFILFFLLPFLALMISHYPVYPDIWTYGDNSCVNLKMDEKFKFLGFGIIYYNSLKVNTPKNISYKNKVVKGMRRSLGILLYIAVFNIFFGVISRFFEVQFDAFTLTLFILILTLFIYALEGKKYEGWKQKLENPNTPFQEQKKTINQIVSYVKWFPGYFMICTSLAGLTALIASQLHWDRWSIIVFLITLGCQMFLYIIFKISRSYLKYVYRSVTLIKDNPEMYNTDILKLFEIHDLGKGAERGENSFYRFFGRLSDNTRYLKLMRFSGILSFMAILWANFDFYVASFLNPLVIILLYIILFYSIFVIIFKHVLYYHRMPVGTFWFENFFKYGIPLIALLLIGLVSYTSKLPNDLHQISLVTKEHSFPLDYQEFLESMTKKHSGNGRQNYFFVGSYGGGLKANLWNLLLLHELEKTSDQEFLNRSLVMSGVSGGAVGMGNFASLLNEQKDNAAIAEGISQIGNSNVLSNELTYLLGRDWVREYLPFFNYYGKDRSFKSMEHHAKNTGIKAYNTFGFEDYWREIYRNSDSTFPALIINTTAVGGQQGVASTVKFPKNTFAGAKMITAFENENESCTLTYFGAISTTNRFPFFSPTAKVPGKGSYLDGGYFDNSGMLSTLEIYDAVAGDSSKPYWDRIEPIFINIINSEDFYISQKVIEYGLKPENSNDTSEIGSIIGTVTSIDKLPHFVLEKIRSRGFEVVLIMMPHKLSYEKIRNSLKGEISEPLKLMEKIRKHNDSIDQALKDYGPYCYDKWGVVQPPLARILSTPAVHYQEAMVHKHGSIEKSLNDILEKYIPIK